MVQSRTAGINVAAAVSHPVSAASHFCAFTADPMATKTEAISTFPTNEITKD
jgi:hypothetical protein